jgi:hypothetical protein
MGLLTHNSYWDDSETSHILTMAGYIAPIKQWEIFDGKWSAVLKEFNVPCAHMTDFVARQEEFEGWPEDERRNFLAKLAKAIDESDLRGLSANVHIEALNRANVRWHLHYDAYPVAATFAIHALRDHSEPDQFTMVLMDRVHRGRTQLDIAESILSDDPRYCDWWAEEQVKWSHLTKGEMKSKPLALQAADFHAWESRAYAETKLGLSDKGKGSHWSGCRESFIGLSASAPTRGAIHSDLEINRLFKRIVARA